MSAVFSVRRRLRSSAPTTRSPSCASRRIRSRPSRACSAACCSTTAPGTASATCSTDSDFYRFEHRLIYAAIGGLINATKPADVITVFEQLQSLGKADECGGLAYLNALAQSVPSAANIRRYAEIVRERAVLRKLVAASDEIATNAFNPQGRPVAQILDEAESKIFQHRRGRLAHRSRASRAWTRWSSQLIDRVNELHENGAEEVTGVRTGFYDLDRMTSGLQAGRPDRAGGAAVDGQDRARAQHRRARRASTKACRSSCSRWKWAPSQLALRMVGSLGRIDQQPPAHRRADATTNGARLSEAVEKLGKVSLLHRREPAR